MIDTGIIITGAIGLVTTVVSGFTSWFFTRRKYNSEVDSNELENLKKSVDIYEKIVTDMEDKLKYYIALAENNRVEVYRLKEIVYRLLNNSCLDNTCTQRKLYTEEQIREILGATKGEETNGTEA